MYRICNAYGKFRMKTGTIPPLRVSARLRREAEAVLGVGETLSAFMLDSLTRSIESRKAQAAFVARGLASGERARKSGDYMPAGKVIGELRRRLARARSRSR
jgi:hypothetical protein